MQRGGVDASGNFMFSAAEVECVTRATQNYALGKKVVDRLHALLDWGLFCGYTDYSVAGMRKWPLGCRGDCYFNRLHFSRYRENAEKTAKQTEQFIQEVQQLNLEKARLCTGMAAVTACRIEEKKLQRTVTVCAGLALLLCLVLASLSVSTLKASVSVAKRERAASGGAA